MIKKLNTIDKILLACASLLIIFTITMIVIFCVFQSVPEVLVDKFYDVFGCEIIIAFGIWYIKKRYARKYEKEDRENGVCEENTFNDR